MQIHACNWYKEVGTLFTNQKSSLINYTAYKGIYDTISFNTIYLVATITTLKEKISNLIYTIT